MCFRKILKKLVMYEADVDINVGCDGFQIRNAGIHWFQSRKLRSVLCADVGYLMKRKTHFGYFHDLRIIRRADYRAEITVVIIVVILLLFSKNMIF